MELRIIADGIHLPDDARERIEKRLAEQASRSGPFTVATVTVERGKLLQPYSWKVSAEIESESWTVRPDGTSATHLDDAIDAMLVELTALLRRVTWVRDGVPRACQWCDHQAFLYVRHPRDADDTSTGAPLRMLRSDTGEWRGELEALVCRACGHVEWFVRDPDKLPIGTRGVIEVTTRRADPYR